MSPSEFNLTPDPRILQMLGEINLEQWKCLAELIDNSVDAFVNAKRNGQGVDSPEVSIVVPTQDREDSAVSVRDNGPGMTLEQLESAVRAGWSGNGPLDNLGLFGMGFNIATARLGGVTEVFTTRAGDTEWTGLRIDLADLRRTRSYQTPRLTRPKADPNVHGTEVRISRLKPEQRVFFSRGSNLSKIRRTLGRVYAPLLSPSDGSFVLNINAQRVQAKRHCHWSPERYVQAPDGRPCHAVEQFDVQLPSRHYCLTCMTTFSGDSQCPTGSPDCKVVELKRRLHGWVGLQRYLHEEDFGLDLIRNGRVIEVQNKDMFIWTGGERPEREYPIDDQRNRGRFIGEIHIDHCRVSYTKDRFERDDASWAEMISLVRGEGPLQPQKAKALGFPVQEAPLYRLFQAFRRSSPQGKTGRWARVLVVKNNERALEMAEAFNRREPDFETDEKWFALIEEEDRTLVGGKGTGVEDPPPPVPPGFIDEPEIEPGQPKAPDVSAPKPPRQKSHALSRTYKHPLLKVEFNVEAYAVDKLDDELPAGVPWSLTIEDPATRTFAFLYRDADPAFRSMTLTPLDALLTELSIKTFEFLRDSTSAAANFPSILWEFRRVYASEYDLNPKDIISSADTVLRDLAIAVVLAHPGPRSGLFDGLPDAAKTSIRRRAVALGYSSIEELLIEDDFLTHASLPEIRDVVVRNPADFFDGKYWDQPYTQIDLGTPQENEDARSAVVAKYRSLLDDAVWLGTKTERDLDKFDRDEIVRGVLSVRLLRRDGAG